MTGYEEYQNATFTLQTYSSQHMVAFIFNDGPIDGADDGLDHRCYGGDTNLVYL